MKIAWLITPAVAIVAAPAIASSQCTFNQAEYSTPDSRLNLSFVNIGHRSDITGDLALRISDARTGKNLFWYYFDEGSLPRTTLISTTNVLSANWHPDPDDGDRPYGTAIFVGMNRDGRLLQSAPTSSQRATSYILIPDLAEVFKVARMWGRTNGAFVLKSCAVGNTARQR